MRRYYREPEGTAVRQRARRVLAKCAIHVAAPISAELISSAPRSDGHSIIERAAIPRRDKAGDLHSSLQLSSCCYRLVRIELPGIAECTWKVHQVLDVMINGFGVLVVFATKMGNAVTSSFCKWPPPPGLGRGGGGELVLPAAEPTMRPRIYPRIFWCYSSAGK
jgi:hypothetical protein